MSEIRIGSSIHSLKPFNSQQNRHEDWSRLRKVDVGSEGLKRSEDSKGISLLGVCDVGGINPFSNRTLVDGAFWSVKLKNGLSEIRGEVSTEAYRGLSDVMEELKRIRQGRIRNEGEPEVYLNFVLKGIEGAAFPESAREFVGNLKREVEKTLEAVRISRSKA